MHLNFFVQRGNPWAWLLVVLYITIFGERLSTEEEEEVDVGEIGF